MKDKEEKFVMRAFKKKERGVLGPMLNSNFNNKRIDCKSHYNSIRTSCNLVSRVWGHIGPYESNHFLEQ
jgi:hypothetical protein